jgi:hypothetical protein
MNFDTTINRQQAPFSGAVVEEQAIKIQSSIACFQFFFWFSFASLKFDRPQKEKKNQCNLVLINPIFSFFRFLFLLTLTGDGWLPLHETQTFLWMIQENFIGKGDVQHKLKGWKP